MTTAIRRTLRADDDGNLLVPLGKDEAGAEVDVLVSPRAPAPGKLSQSQWHEFIARTAGSISDPTFVRHPQGEFEQRDSFE